MPNSNISAKLPILLDLLKSTADIGRDFVSYDGILGLAPNDDSAGPLFMDYLYNQKKIDDNVFSILPGSTNNQTLITFGGY